MSERQVRAWVCDLCGHIWIAGKGGAPEKCAKCRKRGWNKQPAAKPAAPRKRSLPPPIEPSAALDFKARAAGMSDLAVEEGDVCSVTAIADSPRYPVVEVKVEDVVVPLIPPTSESSERFSAAIDRLAQPHPKMGEKCPHNWSSWFLCPKCNSKRVSA